MYPADDLYCANTEDVSKSESSMNSEQNSSKNIYRIEGTFKSLQETSTHLHRVEIISPYEFHVIDNIASCGFFPLDLQSSNFFEDLSSSSKL